MSQSTNKTPGSPGRSNLFGEVIYRYTRAQGINDGVLIDASVLAKEAGFKWPVAITAGAWSAAVAWSDDDNHRQVHQDQSGRLWDVLFMAAYAVRSASNIDRQLQFGLQCIPRNGLSTESHRLDLKLVLGPGDDGEPVITIMLPEED